MFRAKIAIYLSQGLQKGLPRYSRSLQPSKENIQQFKTRNFQIFSILWVIFALLDPDPDSGSGSTDLIESGSNPDPNQKRWLPQDGSGKNHSGYTVLTKSLFLTF
jgi:hypothetical protein